MDKIEQIEQNDEQYAAPAPKRQKKLITAKQRAARVANLKLGRAIRMKKIAAAKNNIEYDVQSETDESDEEVSMEDFTVTKNQKKALKQKHPNSDLDDLRKEMQEMRGVMFKMTKQQKRAQKPRKEGGTKIVVLPQQNSSPTPTKNADYDTILNQLLSSINRK